MKRRSLIFSGLIIGLIGLLMNRGAVVGGASANVDPTSTGAPVVARVESSSRVVCTLPHARIVRSSPAVGDLDDDGVKEIVVGGSDGYLYAVNPEDCSAVPGWPKQVNDYFIPPLVQQQSATQDVESTPVLADIDGDGHLEVIVTVGWMPQLHQNGGVIVFEHDGTVKPGWPKATLDVHGAGANYWHPDGYTDGVFSTPAIGDIDGDEQPDIVYGAFDKCVYVWHADGTPVDGWWDTINDEPARCLYDTIWSSPALVDLDGDDVLDIVIGTDTHPQYAGGSVWAFKGDNTVLWTVYTTQIIQSSPAVGDINGDGLPEIVVGTGTNYPQGYKGITDGHKVYAFDRFGNDLPGWPRPTEGNMYASPSLADLDGDGKLEVLIGCGAEVDFDPSSPTFCNKMYVWRYDGQSLPDYPSTIKRANPWPAGQGSTGMPYGPVLADYDNNGVIDVFLVEAGSWGISIFPYNNPNAVDISHYSDNTLSAPPVVGKLYDSDDDLYLVAAGATSSGNQGAVYIWSLGGSAGGARPWPMFRQNAYRTGRYAMPPRLSVAPNSLLVMHQFGETSDEQKAIWIGNAGDGSFTWDGTSPDPDVTLSSISGTVTTQSQVSVTVSTTGYSTGTYSLGNIVITGTVDGSPVEDSPVSIPVTLYVGQVHKVFLPVTMR